MIMEAVILFSGTAPTSDTILVLCGTGMNYGTVGNSGTMTTTATLMSTTFLNGELENGGKGFHEWKIFIHPQYGEVEIGGFHPKFFHRITASTGTMGKKPGHFQY